MGLEAGLHPYARILDIRFGTRRGSLHKELNRIYHHNDFALSYIVDPDEDIIP